MSTEDRVRSIIHECRRYRLPLDGARLHMGTEALADLKRAVPTATAPRWATGSPLLAYGGIPVVPEGPDRPRLVELRWTVAG